MDFEELRDILTREQRSKLAKLEPDFYESVRAYLDGLREEQKTASDREVPLLADELETAGDRLQRIFKLRVGKIVKLASLNISMEIDGTRYEVDAMTPVERDIYHSVLAAVRQGWSEIAGMLAGKSGPPTPEETPARIVEEVSDAEQIEDVEVLGHGVLDDYTIVRVLKDIPTFMGADSHHYTLAKNDVVTLPNLNAKVLCKRRAVSPVAIQ